MLTFASFISATNLNQSSFMENAYFLLFLLMSWLLCFTSSLAPTKTNSTTDQLTLLTIKDHITYDPRNILANNWSSTSSCCNWVGVTCGVRHVRVTALNLSNMGLEGTIAPHIGNLSFLASLDLSVNNFHGPLPQELGQLRRLKIVSFTENSFTGGLPSWFGNFSRLQQLVVAYNSFTGAISPSIFNMSNLVELDLRSNFIEGDIPKEIGNCLKLELIQLRDNQLSGTMPSAIFNFSSLQFLSLANNSLSGSLPVDMCKNLSNIKILNLSFNKFHGQLPSNFEDCRKLQILSLSNNHLTGGIPNNVGNLNNLKQIFLGGNNLKGTIPPTMFNISSIEVISLSNNSLSGVLPMDICHKLPMLKFLYIHRTDLMGFIPKDIGNCSLQEIDLQENHLTGEIPREIGNLQDLEFLNIAGNNLSGQIPLAIFNISSIEIISLSRNHLLGFLPTDMGFWLPNLKWLILDRNNLDGRIPISICNASKLTVLDLSSNSFFGLIPNILGNLRQLQFLSLQDNKLTTKTSTEWDFFSSLTNCNQLKVLSVSSNPLNGMLPAFFGNLSTSLEEFYATYCHVNGSIPMEVGNFSNIVSFSLSGNRLIGSLPITIGRLQRLQGLYLLQNKLHGFIPHDLCNLQNLNELLLSENELSGGIPTCIGNLTSLRNLDLSFNKLFSAIPSSFWGLNYILEVNLSSNSLNGSMSTNIQNLRVVTLLDLSWNQLSGTIPGTVGGLKDLVFLFLDNNKLQGQIPSSLGDMLSLVSLDLSNNNLSGVIPKSLEKLSYLKNFNVSFNKLEGQIPTEGPFKNFSAQSFMWNYGLCGVVRLKVPLCSTDSLQKHKTIVAVVLKYLLPIIAVTILIFVIIITIKRCLKRNTNSTISEILLPTVTWRRVSYHELLIATDGFSDNMLLGIGSFGSVYRGNFSDGLTVAIKVFKLNSDRAFQSFDMECEVMRNIRHRNLVQIITNCSSSNFKALVLQFMPNGSLEKWLHSNNKFLDIKQRINIMEDVASALDYIHHGSPQSVVHCDLKPNNVLLDEDMVAHVGDFGIAKLLGEGDFVTQTITMASIGYMAPEYGSEGIVSTKCDVYSYGILLMEVFTRKKPTDDMFAGEMSLKSWVNQSLPDAILEVTDTNLFGTNEEQFMIKKDCISSILELAMDCCAELPERRINMGDALTTLKKIKLKYLKDSCIRSIGGQIGREKYG